MVLDKKQTTVAYRCNKCGAGVMGMIDIFTLSAPMIKLKCDCGGSEMRICICRVCDKRGACNDSYA